VDTKKADIEIEVFEDGVVSELLVPAGEQVPVGTVIAMIDAAGAVAKPPAPVPGAQPPASVPAAQPPKAAAVPPPARREHRRRVSPLARRTAAELGVDLDAVTGSGPRGAVLQADVERAAAAAPPATEPTPPPAAAAAVAPSAASRDGDRSAAMRDAIAQLMARSKREIPHYYLGLDIDLGRALAWLEEHNASVPLAERVLPAALLARAVALAAREVPSMNGFWQDGAFQPSDAVHLGFAVSLRGGGLIAPAIHDADRMSPPELMAAIRDLVKRARGGGLRASEMADPTLTLTNLGERGTDATYGVIYPPQVALVGFGRVREQPIAHDGMLGVGAIVTATLSADHRASDGHDGALFLAAVDHHLQHPEKL
jgi:pyruvate dehydrogenase E2 component (dihydrolipoamide acetyltransferase)